MKFAIPFVPTSDGSRSDALRSGFASGSHDWSLPGETLDLQALFARVVRAYSTGTLEDVRDIVAPPLLRRLAGEVADRKRHRHVLSSRLVEVTSAEIIDREDRLLGGWVDIRFVSRMVVALQAADGTVLAGDPVQARLLSEVWTLQRSTVGGTSRWAVSAMVEDE